MKRALYAGSFDPITYGHSDIINKALSTFDVVQVAVGLNPDKAGKRLFSPTGAKTLMEDLFESIYGIGVDIVGGKRFQTGQGMLETGSYSGSVTQHARANGFTHIVRGLRQISDFDNEFVFNGYVEQMDPNIIIAHFISNTRYLHVASSGAKSMVELGETTDWIVAPFVAEAIRAQIEFKKMARKGNWSHKSRYE